jgi:uncharacterized metal-binding protein YceD (DUF177 family)
MGKSHYKIQFGGLSLGEHQFEFEVTQKFFEQFKDSEITKANVHVKANLIKQNSLMHILFSFEGTVNLNCDRCLINYDCPISGQEKLVIKYGNPEESNDEILVLKEGVEEADFTQYLYEYIELAIPSRKVPCEDEELDVDVECDEETLAKFNELKTEEEPSENPEWDKLKNIKFNNN